MDNFYSGADDEMRTILRNYGAYNSNTRKNALDFFFSLNESALRNIRNFREMNFVSENLLGFKLLDEDIKYLLHFNSNREKEVEEKEVKTKVAESDDDEEEEEDEIFQILRNYGGYDLETRQKALDFFF
jgi:undecaprenyl pyrophosphate synthase